MRRVLSPELEAWRKEIRAFLDAELPPSHAFNVEFDDAPDRWETALEFSRKLASKGWIGLTWPVRYGGAGRSPLENQVLLEELAAADAPVVNSVGIFLAAGTILAGGSEEQKATLLPAISSMRTLWAEGLTEPEAGSDLGSLRTRAVRDGDDWVITGQKAFTSWGPMSDVLFVAARTSEEASTSGAISIFVVDLRSPGVTLHPMRNFGGGVQSTTFLDGVRVPGEALIGEEGKGWSYIMGAFYSSGTVEPIYSSQEARLQALLEHGDGAPEHGASASSDIAELALMVQAQRLLAYEVVGDNVQGRRTAYGGGVQQVIAKEYEPRFAQFFDRVLGPASQLTADAAGAPLGGAPEAWYRQSFANHAGGTSQLKRMVLATRGLGLPR
ncbi:acyl-CoA dehydrogenase family protein [Tomitella fengzijianii]|uniref:Acyl-CoA dehydrogenase n=1 Tax=Tomitella fengzijianii TaxID=2597660 RepID=A0A516X6V0_9ACTN|nr:acyl-CoA dehydrogenase family protein [Tomitella fengzijianii]QDQ98798.1 hypothetical protein FO059_17445 [Tomitella fengzijianii]